MTVGPKNKTNTYFECIEFSMESFFLLNDEHKNIFLTWRSFKCFKTNEKNYFLWDCDFVPKNRIWNQGPNKIADPETTAQQRYRSNRIRNTVFK